MVMKDKKTVIPANAGIQKTSVLHLDNNPFIAKITKSRSEAPAWERGQINHHKLPVCLTWGEPPRQIKT